MPLRFPKRCYDGPRHSALCNATKVHHHSHIRCWSWPRSGSPPPASCPSGPGNAPQTAVQAVHAVHMAFRTWHCASNCGTGSACSTHALQDLALCLKLRYRQCMQYTCPSEPGTAPQTAVQAVHSTHTASVSRVPEHLVWQSQLCRGSLQLCRGSSSPLRQIPL